MAAGFTWVKGSPSAFVATPMKAVTQVTQGFDMGKLVSDAAELMQEMIATRGTGKTWSKPWNGRSGSYPGRVDTGYMVNSVSWRVEMEDGKLVGEFGWINRKEAYFAYQDAKEGFTHNITGEKIEGMMALQDAGIQAREEFMRRLSQALKR